MGFFGDRFEKKRSGAEGDQRDETPIELSRASDDELFRYVGAAFLPAGRDEVIVRSPAASPRIVSRIEAEYLARCVKFRRLADHARVIAEELGLGDEGANEILQALRSFAAEGLFRPLSAAIEAPLVSSEEPAPGPEAIPAIASVGCVSANRLTSARRALESYMDNSRRFGRRPEWVLYDDSAEAAERIEYRAMLARLKSESRAPLLYAGLEEKKDFARALSAEGFPMDLLEFCLFGPPGLFVRHGANHNARLLDTVGSLGISVDDDTICDMGALSGASGGPLCVSGDPMSFRFFREAAEARGALEHRNEDFLALHESMLGCSARLAASSLHRKRGQYMQAADLDEASDRLIHSMAAGTGRIVATQMGIAGDSAMGSTLYFLFSEGASRTSLVGDELSYRQFMEGRAVARMVATHTICDSPPFMTYAVGMDNRQLLPPFLPVLRNSDGLFGNMLPIVMPDALFGFLPRAVGHEPPEKRSSNASTLHTTAGGMGTADMIGAIIRAYPANWVAASSITDRMRAIGRFLVGVGALAPGELEEQLAPLYLREKAKLLVSLEALLVEHGEESRGWAGDVRSCIDAVRTAIPLRENIIPGDIVGLDHAARLRSFKDLVLRYGELLEAWPDMVAATKGLRERGIRVAKAV